jgi:hypothetical protein
LIVTITFKTLKIRRDIFYFLFACSTITHAQQIIKGYVVEKDTSQTMPFVYIINKSNGSGTMSDNNGRFSLYTNQTDTLILSYVGYAKEYIPVKNLKANARGEVKISLLQLPINLGIVNINTFKFKPYEREYMNDIIDKSKIKTIDYFNSPIDALYNQFSKVGKQTRKLAKIFEAIIIEEQVQKKLSKEILIRLTGDENVDYYGFRKYCYYVNDYFIINHDGVDLYSKVMECYKRWKREGR